MLEVIREWCEQLVSWASGLFLQPVWVPVEEHTDEENEAWLHE